MSSWYLLFTGIFSLRVTVHGSFEGSLFHYHKDIIKNHSNLKQFMTTMKWINHTTFLSSPCRSLTIVLTVYWHFRLKSFLCPWCCVIVDLLCRDWTVPVSKCCLVQCFMKCLTRWVVQSIHYAVFWSAITHNKSLRGIPNIHIFFLDKKVLGCLKILKDLSLEIIILFVANN